MQKDIKILSVAVSAPVIRIPMEWVQRVEPDKRKKRVKLLISYSEDVLTVKKL